MKSFSFKSFSVSISFKIEFTENLFLDLLKYELINLLDEDYSTTSDTSSEEFNEKTEKEEINVAVDKEGFYSLTD